jgi:solute carrier family 25 carnitine/acylcarnitine transporter 20/29
VDDVEVPSGGVYFATYEWLQIAFAPRDIEKGNLSTLRTILAGGLAGIANWIIALPPDVLKSRLQTGFSNIYKLSI